MRAKTNKTCSLPHFSSDIGDDLNGATHVPNPFEDLLLLLGDAAKQNKNLHTKIMCRMEMRFECGDCSVMHTE